jgi:drug/metabolite transporter (DMT)-like permease
MVCFAVNSVITRYLVLVSQISPFLLTVIRFVSGLGTLLIVSTFRPATFRHDRPGFSYFLGALFLGAYAFSISYGYLFIPVAAGTFVFYTFVVVTMVAYSVTVDHARLTFRLVLGQLLGLLGVLIITFSRIGSVTLLGVILMAATGTSWGLYSAYGKKFGNAFSYTYNSFLILGAGAIIASEVLWSSAEPIFTDISVQDLSLALYMGMVSTALSYIAWNETVKKIPASLGGLVQLVVPVLAPVMGIAFLGEQVNTTLVIGGGLVLAGIYLAQPRRC